MSLENFFNHEPPLNESISSQLAIEISAKHFILSAKNSNGEIIGLKQYFLNNSITNAHGIEEIIALLNSNPALKHPYKKTIISINTPYSLIVPESFYDEYKTLTLLQNQFLIGNDVKILSERIETENAFIISAISDSIFNKLTQLFPTAQVISGALILFNIPSSNAKFIVNIFIDQEKIILNAFKDFKLILFNTYSIISDEDFLYFILNALDKLNFDLSNTHATLMGLIYESDSKFNLLSNYIGSVSLANLNHQNINNSQIFYSNIHSHLCA